MVEQTPSESGGAYGEIEEMVVQRRAPSHFRSGRRPTVVLALGFGLLVGIALAFAPGMPGTQALFVAVIRNAGNTFGVPAVLAPTNVGATPQAGGSIRVQWNEPGATALAPVATSWAGAYYIYRSESPATPSANATPHATVVSSGSGIGTFIDGTVAGGAACEGAKCPVNNTRYYYWVRALSRQTGYASPIISATTSAAADGTAPQVISVSPGNSAVAIPASTSVQITFSEPVDFDSAVGAACISPIAAPNSCVSVVGNQSRWLKSSGVLLELKPNSRLASNTSYGVSFIASGTFAVRDLAGNTMPATTPGTVPSFTTEVPASTVSIRWRSPAVKSQEYMPASGPIVGVTFAEAMDQASTTSAFQLFEGAGCIDGSAIPVTATWNSTSNAVAFTPVTSEGALKVGLMASPTFGVYTYSLRFNEPSASGRSVAGNAAAPIACANSDFIPSASILAFDLADVPAGATIPAPSVVAGETLVLRSASGPWRQGAYTTLKSVFDEARTSNVASSTVAISGDNWSGLPLTVPVEAPPGLHYVGVQNDAISADIGQDVRTAFRAVNVVEPTIIVTTYDAADQTETASRTLLSPSASVNGDTVRFRVQVTAQGRDGSGVRPVTGVPVQVRALTNPVAYGARICATLTSSSCTGTAKDLTLTTDSQGVVRGFLTAPNEGAPFNTIVLLASAGGEYGSTVLTDPAPIPPSDLRYSKGTGRFSWTPSPTRGVVGYRLRLVPIAPSGIVDVVIDVGDQLTVGIPEGAVVADRAYRVVVEAYDASGRLSAHSEPIEFVAPTLTPTPTPTAFVTATSTATFGLSSTATAAATAAATPATALASPSSTPLATVTTLAPTPTVGASSGGVTPITPTQALGGAAATSTFIVTPFATPTLSPQVSTTPATSTATSGAVDPAIRTVTATPATSPAFTAVPTTAPSPTNPVVNAPIPTIVATPMPLSVAPTMPAPTMVSASGVPASTPLPLVSTTVALPPTPVPSSGNSGRGEVAQW